MKTTACSRYKELSPNGTDLYIEYITPEDDKLSPLDPSDIDVHRVIMDDEFFERLKSDMKADFTAEYFDYWQKNNGLYISFIDGLLYLFLFNSKDVPFEIKKAFVDSDSLIRDFCNSWIQDRKVSETEKKKYDSYLSDPTKFSELFKWFLKIKNWSESEYLKSVKQNSKIDSNCDKIVKRSLLARSNYLKKFYDSCSLIVDAFPECPLYKKKKISKTKELEPWISDFFEDRNITVTRREMEVIYKTIVDIFKI